MPKPIPYELGYRVNFTHKGIKYRKKFPTEIEAQEFIASIFSPNAEAATTLEEEIRLFIRWQEKIKKRSASWVQSLSYNLSVFAKQTKARSARQIKFKHIDEFYDWWFQNNNHRSEKTWEMYRQSISVFLNFMSKRDTKVVNYAADPDFKVKIQENSPDTFELEEVNKILNYFDLNDTGKYPYGTAFRILYYTGIRLGEFVNLKWSDINLTGKIKTLECGTKIKETRTIPIADELLPYLLALPQNTVYVFDNGFGKPLHHKKTYNRVLDKAMYMSGIPKARHVIHSFRHSCCRYLIESGTDLPLVQKIMGHRDIRTTLRYAKHYSLDRAVEAVNKIPSLCPKK